MSQLQGTVLRFNVSPKGFQESFLLQTSSQLVQVNFPHGAGSQPPSNIVAGQNVSIEATRLDDDRPSSHPVYEWAGNDAGELSGIVEHINYARHGEANGAILTTGEFIHLKPHGARQVKLSVGQKLAAEGERRVGPAGQVVIEATKVNGVALDDHKPAKKPKKK